MANRNDSTGHLKHFLAECVKRAGRKMRSLQLQATCQMPTSADSANPSTALQD